MLNARRVETAIDLRLLVPGRSHVPVPATLTYDPTDAFAMKLTMVTGPGNSTVEWVFARQLLVDGVVSPSGEGDVHVWPVYDEDRSTTFLSLSSPSGSALLETDTAKLVEFLTLTLQLVPLGTEGRYLDMDSELMELLAG